MNIIYEKPIPSSIDEAISNLKSHLDAEKVKIITSFNLKEQFKESGYYYPYNFWVFEVSNPEIAVSILNSDPKASYLLPCRLAMFETEFGVKIGFVKPSKILKLISEQDNPDVDFKTIEDKLKNIIDAMAQ